MAFAAPLVGRTEDLTRLVDVLGGRAAEGTALVLGDAGIGKSRLLSEAAQQLSGVGVTVLQGACLPLTEALPLLPLVEALRGLARRDDGRLFSDALAAQPAYVCQEIARLLPELGAGSADEASGPGEGWQRERLFTSVRELLAAVAARGPAVLLVEDLHWADRTTLDLLRFLVGSGVSGPVPLAVSCRGDEPVTSSALLDWLAVARSAPGVAELTLGPLAPEPAAEQAAALLGHRPSAAMLEALYRRTAGNPFFTEQLVAAGLTPAEEGRSAMAASMPPGLAALLSARVRRASQPARQVLAALAVAGRPVDEATLTAVTELAYEVVEDALIELIESRLVTSDHDAFFPRHQLLADVVTADLLAGRRRALHASFAAWLAARADSDVAAEIAAHWAAAGREDEELAWSATAGKAAEAIYAFAEAAQHWERVTQLWDVAAAKPPELRLGEAYIHAIGDRYNCSDSVRAGVLTEAGLERVAEEDEPYERAVLLSWASVYRRVESLDAAVRASEDSVRLFATLPPSHWHVSALGTYGMLLDIVQRPDDAAEVLLQGLSVARASGSPDLEAGALTDLAGHELFAGDWQRGRAHLARASELTRESHDVEALLLVATAETDTLLRMGHLHETVLVAERALERTGLLGGGSFPDTLLVTANAAAALLELGRISDARLLIDPLTTGKPSFHDRYVHHLRARLDIVRGDLDGASDRLDAVRSAVPDNLSILLEIERDAAEIALWRRRPEDAAALVTTFLSRITHTPDSRDAGRLLGSGMRALGDLADRARARGDERALRHALEGAEQLVARHSGLRCDPFADHPAVATAEAEHATWRAERARLNEADQTDLWEVAADAWNIVERPHRRAYALWRQAEALLATDNASQAATALRLAASLATDMAPLMERIGAVARRARVDLGVLQTPTVPSDALGYSLTERELDVLRLLARGHTNAQIGAVLFMSPKTASVHVTHILRKLGVTGRVQAATVAERAGLLDDGESD